MVDFVLVLVDFGLIFVGSMLGGAFVNLLLHGSLAWRIQSLEKGYAGQKGQAIRQEQAAEDEVELVAAIGEAMELHSQGRPITDIIKEVAAKHPSVAMKFIKQFMAGKLKLPAGLGGLKF